MALKFSKAKPNGSMRLWQEAQSGFSRCIAKASRRLMVLPSCFFSEASSEATFAGGGGGGVPRKLSRMNNPRFTGEVRVGFEVTANTLPMVNKPPRGLSGGSLTKRMSPPSTPGMP